MTALLASLTSFLKSLTFFTIVTEGHEGVHFRGGKVKRTVGPGFWFQLPVTDTFFVSFVAHQIYDVDRQILTTTDGVAVVIAGRIGCEVRDLAATYYSVLNVWEALVDEAGGVIAEVVMDRTFADLLTERDQIEEEVETHLRKTMDHWGIRLLSFKVTDLTKCRAIRLLGDMEGVDD